MKSRELKLAIKNNDIEAARECLQVLQNDNLKLIGYGFIEDAIKDNKEEIAKLLLESEVVYDTSKYALLEKAIKDNKVEIIRLFSPSVIDTNAFEAAHKSDPIGVASYYCNKEAIEALINSGFELSTSSLISAVYSLESADAKIDTIDYLIKKGANINETNGIDSSILAVAIRGCETNSRDVKLVQYLIEKGAKLHDNEDILKSVSSTNCPELLPFALAINPNINQARFIGETPLYNAAAGGREKMVIGLIEAGAEVNYEVPHSFLGNTALTKALFCNHPSVVDILIKEGATFSSKDIEGVIHFNKRYGSKLDESINQLITNVIEMPDKSYDDKISLCQLKNPDVQECLSAKNLLLIKKNFPEQGEVDVNKILYPLELANSYVKHFFTQEGNNEERELMVYDLAEKIFNDPNYEEILARKEMLPKLAQEILEGDLVVASLIAEEIIANSQNINSQNQIKIFSNQAIDEDGLDERLKEKKDNFKNMFSTLTVEEKCKLSSLISENSNSLRDLSLAKVLPNTSINLDKTVEKLMPSELTKGG